MIQSHFYPPAVTTPEREALVEALASRPGFDDPWIANRYEAFTELRRMTESASDLFRWMNRRAQS